MRNKYVRHACRFKFARHQRGGTGKGHFGAEFQKSPHVAAGDAAVQDVADDGDLQVLEGALLLAHCENIQQRLGRMAVRAVSGVDHAALQMLGDEGLRAGGAVAHHDQVDLQRFDVADGVEQGFALQQTAARSLHIHDVGAEALFGEFKGDPGAGAGFDEEVDDGFAAQGGNFFHVPLRNLLELLGGVEEEGDLLGAQVVETEQIFSGPLHRAVCPSITIGLTVSAASSLRRCRLRRRPRRTAPRPCGRGRGRA